jgi:hypothetical protein
MMSRWSGVLAAAMGALAVCAALTVLPRWLEAAGTVTDCSSQVDLQNKVAGGGR